MKKHLRWKKEPHETGLRAIGAGPRSSRLHDGHTRYAMVSALWQGYQVKGWYWVTGWDSGVPHMNTCNAPCATESEAKTQAHAYVRQHLKD